MSTEQIKDFDEIPETEESIEEENQEETPDIEEESEDTESPDEDTGESEDDDQLEEQEWYENDHEYLKELGVDDVEDIPSLVSKYKELETKLQEVSSKSNLDDSADKTQPQQDADLGFKENFISEYVTKMLEGTPGVDKNTKDFVSSYSKVLDNAVSPMFKKVFDVNQRMLGGVDYIVNYLRDDSYNRLPSAHKSLVDRKVLDNIMNKNGWLDYRRAMRAYAVQDPKVFQQILDTTEKRGVGKGKQMRFKKSTAQRRATPQTKPSRALWDGYVDSSGELDMVKLNRLSTDRAESIIDAYADFLTRKK